MPHVNTIIVDYDLAYLHGRMADNSFHLGGNRCHIWIGPNNGDGYGRLGLLTPGGKTQNKHAAHRAAWVIANGPIPNGLYVLHDCDNRACINPEHLFLGTQKENIRDMGRKGRRGDPTPKLTEVEKREARTSRKPVAHLARELGASRAAIYHHKG